MLSDYNKKLFFVLFGLSITVYTLSVVHFLSGFENKIFIGGIILLISTGLSVILSKKLSQPLEKLNEGVKRIAQGDFSFRINVTDSKEFIELSKNFNSMAMELSQSYMKLKEQTENLMRQNEELQEFNAELEASYEQLEVLTHELEISERKYRLLVDNILDILWVTDKNFIIEFVNSRVVRYLNYTPPELIGKSILEIVDEESKETLKDMMAGKINFSEINFKNKEGLLVITETHVKRLKVDGNVVGIQGISRDITEIYHVKQQIVEKNNEILAISDVGRLLTSGSDMKEVLNNIVEKVANILNSPLCTIREHDKKSQKFILVTKGGELKDYPISSEIILPQQDINDLVNLKEIKIKGVDEFPHDNNLTSIFVAKEVFSAVIVPLVSRNETIGILTVWTSTKTVKNMSLLRSIASAVSVAIENSKLYDEIKKLFIKTIEALAYAVEAKDVYTKGHSMRVSQYAALIGEYMGLSREKVEQLRIAGILHDIGKIGISDAILLKAGKLTDEEYKVIKSHPEISRRILMPIDLPEEILEAVSKHHERYDGKGYPYGLKGEEIPIEAAILGVADAFDAMTSDRSYRKGMNVEEAINELLKYKGTQFHPEVVDTFISLYMNEKHRLEEIKNQVFSNAS
ncbi:PAS domain S-box-containing protein/HDIG domain-containing protein [Thermoanaerobacter uzonensis DSM 18761]|uniref:PAS domain S-box-containing protein/HDIG domain-containing protein n=1 Tax=Thermoanaerobacter uzonensis DSM 18761 TaxID=1123369 RepID=A0A1M4YJM9_9THEO|nr:HD domain-containing phosphohydrolase [Thermoanaerobacter uzonensis]SHF05692.1 PAS domain S-box-containing protein/HDIG domain-containing protein [Thermoanaerobacter uzonensis DSM 18761]